MKTITESFVGHNVRFLLIVACLSVLTACSSNFYVVVVNDSASLIKVEYSVKRGGDRLVPTAREIAGWRDAIHESSQWNTPIQMNVSDDGQRFEVEIPAKTVLVIDRGHYVPTRKDEGDLTRIESIRFITRDGEISYVGRRLLSQFVDDKGIFVKTFHNELAK